jgi:hypothetical protein
MMTRNDARLPSARSAVNYRETIADEAAERCHHVAKTGVDF